MGTLRDLDGRVEMEGNSIQREGLAVATDTLTTSLDKLEKNISALRSALGPVLRPDNVKEEEAQKGRKEPRAGSEVRATLYTMVNRVLCLNDAVSDTLQRLDL